LSDARGRAISIGGSTAGSLSTRPRSAGSSKRFFVDEQLLDFADALDVLDPVDEAVLGGDRAAELRLLVEHQMGGRAGLLAVECSLTPSGDDPNPYLRWIIPGSAVDGHMSGVLAA
jgi:hypothetical protein